MPTSHDLDLTALARWANERVPDALFWAVSGSHSYGFPSADSDIDLRGCFRAPLRALAGLRPPAETLEPKGTLDGREVEAVAHEAGKYLRMLSKHNGYVLEQVFSPLVAHGADFLARLRPVAAKCVTKHCHNHYRGFLHTQRNQFEKESPKRAKTLLYAYRVALTGVHLLETGEVETHLPTLNERFKLPFIPELIERKAGAEFGALSAVDVEFHTRQLTEWEHRLAAAHEASTLPTDAPADELNALLLELRDLR
ncbi:nucleotidyltransferase domain-containing protein [Gemmata sp. JC717]|uniref:nucleotidyltransferase domain-containing protein n=1 Tax=Gemmata algarum TaxID=2975278 RepID=UPI0021BB8D0F|nr:nucleotidyltransferase domain-containing protein [Gemmata algarum]MDY3551613.1 nucleotidyltransferase domain-containing protein [Gemmata algarum]